jgi:uncharacterized protein YwgA
MTTRTRVDIPWEKYGTIAYLAEHVSACGKTVLQKLVYFLQEWKCVPLGYDYEFYTYGPFSAALMGDLDYTASLEAVQVKPGPMGGYSIEAGARSEEIQGKAADFIQHHKAAVDEVIRVFGGSSAARLELLATTYYTYSFFRSRGSSCGDKDIIETVHSLKPGKFTDDQVSESLGYLRKHHVIAA